MDADVQHSGGSTNSGTADRRSLIEPANIFPDGPDRELKSALVGCRHTVRRLTVDDIPWLLSLAHERYRPFDPGKALIWLLGVIRNEREMLGIRAEEAFLVASLGGYIWFPKEPECHVVLLCAKEGYHWEAVRLLRHSIEWAREKKCVRWMLNSDTHYDFEMLARRVKAKPLSMRYSLDLSNG